MAEGTQGGLAMEVTFPDGFNKDTGKCPMVRLIHGIGDGNMMRGSLLLRALQILFGTLQIVSHAKSKCPIFDI